MHKAMRKVLQSVPPTPRCGALDDDKKAMVIVLVGQGASRREAAELVKCHHTTIGRTAARDGAFGAKLAQVEAAAHLEAGDMIRRAASDPKYWRAAAWMLERRNPEDYARRDPTTFTADQVMSLLASFSNEARSLVPQEKTAEFERLFEDVLDEIEAKSGPAKREEDSKQADKESTRLAQEKPSRNGDHSTNGVADVTVSSSRVGQASPASAGPPTNGKALAEHKEGEGPSSEALCPQTNPLPEGEGKTSLRSAAFPEEERDELFELDSDASPLEDADEIEPIDDDAVPLDLLRRRKELDAELAAHLGGYAVAPPSPAARDVLRDFHRRFMHHPRHRVAAGLAKDALRKVFDVNDLQHPLKDCTTAPNTEGRCNNGVVQANGEAVVNAK